MLQVFYPKSKSYPNVNYDAIFEIFGKKMFKLITHTKFYDTL